MADASQDPLDSPSGKNQSAQASDFVQGAEERDPGLLADFVLFLREQKAWWMLPILVALALIAFVAWLSTTAAAPFIYPLF